MMLLSPIFILLASLATTPRMAVAPFAGGEGVKPPELKSLAELLASSLRRTPNWDVMTYGELEAVMSQEQINQLVGCGSSDCYVALDRAGVTLLATGSLGRIGESWLLSLKVIDVAAVRTIATADRRVRGNLDAVLDVLPIAASELVEHASKRLAATAPDVPVTAPAPTKGDTVMPAGYAAIPFTDKDLAARLRWLGDGKGRLVAFENKEEAASSREIFSGDKKGVYRQRIIGGGAQGTKEWDVVFWEPRVRERWRAGLQYRDGKYALQCGDTQIDLAPLSAAESAKVPLFDTRWQRQALFIGRDDEGNYYYVDAKRGEQLSEHRLFVGPKKRLRQLPVNDVIVDSGGVILMSDEGRLIVREAGAAVPKMAWAVGKSEQALTALDLFHLAPTIYTDLGPYAGQPLGTLCDPELGR